MWFRIDASLGMPIYLQIVGQVEDAADRGILCPGDRLPSIRDVAVEAAVNPNTVAHAYRILEQRGVVETRRGQGTFLLDHQRVGELGEIIPHIDRLLDAARQHGVGDHDVLRLVERRVLGRRRSEEGEIDDQ